MNNKYNQPRIYIDIDMVLANLTKKLGELFPNHQELYHGAKLWPLISDFEHFFYYLEPFEDARSFVSKILQLYGRTHYVSILTALPYPTGELITASNDKLHWIIKYINFDIDVHTIIGGENKFHYLNKHGDILIDDSMKNLIPWCQHGGYGIHHVSFEQSLEQLKIIVDKQK